MSTYTLMFFCSPFVTKMHSTPYMLPRRGKILPKATAQIRHIFLQLDFVSHDVWINNNGISFSHFYHEKQDLNKKCSEWGLWQNKFSTCCSFFNEIIFVELQTCLTSIQQCKLQIKRLKFAIMQNSNFSDPNYVIYQT